MLAVPAISNANNAREPILSADAILYYWDKADEFIDDYIIRPASATVPNLRQSPDQRALAKEISIYRRVAVESGHGVGKSCALSWIGYWFLITRFNPIEPTKLICTAPTYHQLADILWPEFMRWGPLSGFANLIEIKRDEIYIKDNKRFCFGRAMSPKDENNAQGSHAPHLLVLADEAFSIDNERVWPTIDGYFTQDDNRIILAGQHTKIVGYVHECFNRDRDAWRCLRFDSEKSPLANPAFAIRIAKRYGKDSDVYRVRVKGMAPKGDPDAFLQLVDIEAAKARDIEPDPLAEFHLGVDCARFGDDLTVVTSRLGHYVFDQVVNPRTDTDDIVSMVLTEVRRIRKDYGVHQVCHVKVDATGGYGAGVVDALNKNQTDRIIVYPIIFNEDGNEEYQDKITVMWGEIRDVLGALRLPNCDFLTEELAGRKKKKELDRRGRERLESKADFKKDHGVSPDRSDSLALCITHHALVERVLARYVSTSPDYRRNLRFDWAKMDYNEARVYGVVVREPNTGIYGNWFFWSRKTHILRVYAEWVTSSPVLDELIPHICSLAQVPTKPKPAEVCVTGMYGNDACFENGFAFSRLLRRRGIHLRRNVCYDEAAAIAVVTQMLADKQVVVDYSGCPETDRQYRTWRLEKGRPAEGFPLCQALLTIVSQLREEGEMAETPPLQAYGKEKQEIRRKLIESAFDHFPTQKRREDDWMAT